MKVRILYLVCLIVIVQGVNTLIRAANIPIPKGHTLSIVADEWYPMNGKPGSDRPGFMIEIAETLAAELGVGLDYRIMPWDKALNMVSKGIFDCVIGAHKKDAPGFIFPNHHWGVDQLAFYGQTSNHWAYSGLDSLSSQQIGVISGYSYGEEMDNWLMNHPKNTVRLDNNDALTQLSLMLINQRLDLVLESQAVMENKLKHQDWGTQLKQVSLIGEKNPLFLACSPHPRRVNFVQAVLAQMDAAFVKLKAQKGIEPILSRYGVKPWWSPL